MAKKFGRGYATLLLSIYYAGIGADIDEAMPEIERTINALEKIYNSWNKE